MSIRSLLEFVGLKPKNISVDRTCPSTYSHHHCRRPTSDYSHVYHHDIYANAQYGTATVTWRYDEEGKVHVMRTASRTLPNGREEIIRLDPKES